MYFPTGPYFPAIFIQVASAAFQIGPLLSGKASAVNHDTSIEPVHVQFLQKVLFLPLKHSDYNSTKVADNIMERSSTFFPLTFAWTGLFGLFVSNLSLKGKSHIVQIGAIFKRAFENLFPMTLSSDFCRPTQHTRLSRSPTLRRSPRQFSFLRLLNSRETSPQAG